MTIIEAINYIDSIKPNNYSQSDKLRWLSKLDARIKEEVIDTHEDPKVTETPMYDDSSFDAELLAPHPYDEIYPLWLEAQIDYANGEYTKYNNSMSMFNYSYSSFERWYNRKHMPIGGKLKFI